MSGGAAVNISVEGHWSWSWRTAGVEEEQRGAFCAMCVVFTLYVFFPPRLSALQEVRREEELVDLFQAAAKAHLSSIHTNQVLHKTLAQTTLCCQIVSASNVPTAPRLGFCFVLFWFVLFCFSVGFIWLPASCLVTFVCDLVYFDFHAPFFFVVLSLILSNCWDLSQRQMIRCDDHLMGENNNNNFEKTSESYQSVPTCWSLLLSFTLTCTSNHWITN